MGLVSLLWLLFVHCRNLSAVWELRRALCAAPSPFLSPPLNHTGGCPVVGSSHIARRRHVLRPAGDVNPDVTTLHAVSIPADAIRTHEWTLRAVLPTPTLFRLYVPPTWRWRLSSVHGCRAGILRPSLHIYFAASLPGFRQFVIFLWTC